MSLRKGNTIISGAGTDGFSPTATVTKTDSVSTLIVTDINGTTSTQILDGGQIIQHTQMPTASAENVDNIAQYTGTTDSTYTNGYFYKCVNNSGTYSWQNISVQKSLPMPMYIWNKSNLNSSITSAEKIDLINIVNAMLDAGQQTPIVLSSLENAYDHNHGQFILTTSSKVIDYILGNNVSTRWFEHLTAEGIFQASGEMFKRTTIDITFKLTIVNKRVTDITNFSLTKATTPYYFTKTDDYKSYTGYDGTKTQTLKSVNGTLTWVDD